MNQTTNEQNVGGWTPGPWTLGAGRSIHTSSGDFHLSYGKDPKTGTPHFTNFCELDRNAHLIAAAPDLYTALEMAERVIRYAAQEATGRVDREKVGGWIHHADQAASALAKARKGGGE